MNLPLQLMTNGLVNAVLFAILAVGFGLIWRTIRVFHIAYGGLFVLCAYIFFVLVSCCGFSHVLGILMTMVIAGAIGVLVEVGFYRPFYRKRAS